MEFKATLNEYTATEFKSLVSTIWEVEVDEAAHALLIDHFDKIVGHPLGADLIFHPTDTETGNAYSIDSVVSYVRRWHTKNGAAAFKDESWQAAISRPSPRLNPQERKAADSMKELSKVKQVVAGIDVAAKSADTALLHFAGLLDQWQAKSLDARSIVEHSEEMTALEMAQCGAARAIHALEFLKLKVQFAKSDAERNATSPFRDPSIQSQVLEVATRCSAEYLATLAASHLRHRQLHERSEPLFAEAEEHLVRRLSAPGVEIDATPSVVQQQAWACQWRPSLMFAVEKPVIDRNGLTEMKQAIRSAIAEFSWQATSLDNQHPRTFSGVVSFSFDHWKERDWYACSVPLGDLMPIDGYDWQVLARTVGELDLPYRLFSRKAPTATLKVSVGLKQIITLEQICLTPTNGDNVPAKTRVVAVDQDPTDGFSLAFPVPAPVTIRWNKTSGLLDPSRKPERAGGHLTGGLVDFPRTPLLEPFETIVPVRFDDCVVVFPPGSGLEPLYLMFKRHVLSGTTKGIYDGVPE